MDKRVFRSKLADFFVRNFDVSQDKEDELETIDTISKGIEFKGTKYANSTVCRIVGGASRTSQKSFI